MDRDETRRDARRARMLDAAARVFGHSSFEQASMDEIAREAGVGKPTLYRYFPSKDALFGAVFEQALDELEARLEGVLAREDEAELRLAGMIAEIIPTFRRHLVSLRYLSGRAAVADQSNRRIFRQRRERIGSYLAKAVATGVADGEMRPVDGTRTAQLILGMLWSATATSQDPDADIAAEVTDLVLHGVMRPATRPASARACLSSPSSNRTAEAVSNPEPLPDPVGASL